MTEPVTAHCAVCGAAADGPPPTWSMQVSARGDGARTTWLCERCTRQNVRSIEGRLDEAWW